MNTTTNTAVALTRANKLTIKTLSDGTLQADFYRTHKHLTSTTPADMGYALDTKANKALQREMFRQYCAEHSAMVGIDYDPINRQTVENTRLAKYTTEEEVLNDATNMVARDVDRFIEKLPDLLKVHVKDSKLTMDSIAPKTTTAKGTPLSQMGIEQGCYVSNGNLAWFDIEGTVTLIATKGEEIYVPLQLELVSGQLKKFRMTQTQFNEAVKLALAEIGYTGLEPEKKSKTKAEKSAKVGLGDEEHEGLHMDMSPEEEAKAMQEAEEVLAKLDAKAGKKSTTRKTRKSSKTTKVEG